MNRHNAEIELLRIEVENKLGKPLKSPTDFNQLSLCLQKEIKEDISISTIKRLWGYADANHRTSYTTLSILSRFLGYSDWEDYCMALRLRIMAEDYSKDENGHILTFCLKSGDLIEVTGENNYKCVIEYIGGNSFRMDKESERAIRKDELFYVKTFDRYKNDSISKNDNITSEEEKDQNNK
ncbi:MAG: hypothetical protein Q4D41_03920 [Prevotellaceae bacterium]|nr:hypothetical protein [Prevotellaceae bacterium]